MQSCVYRPFDTETVNVNTLMASSGKFDLSSVSPDKPLYNSTQRRSYSATSLDRSSSFRDNVENPSLSSFQSLSRSTSSVTQADVTKFFQCLRFDPKSMAAEHKFNRYGDFRKLASAVLGSPDESPSGSLEDKLPNPSPEDLKRLKAGLRESTIKARERVKVFSETLSVITKCFPGIPTRKRSRPDALPGDRSNGLLLNRAPMGAAGGKMGTQSHSLTNALDFEQQQQVKERAKNVIPNKRTRTSMVDQRAEVRPNTPARSSGNSDPMVRLSNSRNPQGEDQSLHIVPDGLETTKMKKKRTGIKTDTGPIPSSVSTKVINGYTEPRKGMPPRHPSDSMSRLNDSHGLRPGAANGIMGGVKADGPAQQASLGMRSSITRPEQETASFHYDKIDRSTSSEKERTNLRSVNNSCSPTSSTKLHGPARGPRSGPSVVPKSPTVVQRATASSDFDMDHGTNKNPGQFRSSNRKRPPTTRSLSPPVAQWADRRPQKISRTARKPNLAPILSNNGEVPTLDNCSDVTGSENLPGVTKRFLADSPQQFKSKGDHFSPTLSGSEESGATEIRSRDKGKNHFQVAAKGKQNVQKVSTSVPPVRKNKMVNGEDVRDGIRRQTRTGWGFGSSRGVATPVEKIRHVGTPKQHRAARQGFDKSESKLGRPPTRKLSDRKAYINQKYTTYNAAADFPVGSDNGDEALLAAAKAAINPNHALSSPFWRQTEPLFSFVSDADMSYLRQQIQGCVHQDIDKSGTLINGAVSRSIEPSPRNFAFETKSKGEIPLCQRLLAALISERDDEVTFSGTNNKSCDIYESAFEFETDLGSNGFNHRSLQNYELGGRGNFSGQKLNSALRFCKESTHTLQDQHVTFMSDSTVATGFDHCHNGRVSDPVMTTGISFTDYEYTNMSLNERLLVEIQSIGLSPKLVPDSPHNGNEGISGEICQLEEKLREQVSRKKCLLDNLLESTNAARELQEKEYEQLCIDKLSAITYQKYMGCWGPDAPKGVGSKVAKQSALGFVRRTLDRCHEFESTGKSCFAEPVYKEVFQSGSSQVNDTQLDAATDDEFGKVNGKSVERGSVGTQLSPSLNNHDKYSSDTFLSSEQSIGKDESVWSSRVKKRELYLDDVVASTSSGFGTTILNSAKGKRSERDREGKGNGLTRNGGPKVGRPPSGKFKGERKNKAKVKQKTTQLSASRNGPIGKISDQNKTFSSVMKSFDMRNNNAVKEKDEYTLPDNDTNNNTVKEKGEDTLLDNDTEEPLDFSHLQLPEIDVLGEQGEDIGSWLNIDEDILQDDDIMGLEIPMDDLSDLNMMV